MNQSYFMRIYKRRWIYRLIPITILILIIFGMLWASKTIYDNNTNNPYIIKTFEDYNEAIEEDKYSQIVSEELYDLGLDMKRTTSKLGIKINESTEARIVATEVDGKILAIALPVKVYEQMLDQEEESYTFKGTLTDFEDKDYEVLKDNLIVNGIPPEQVESLMYMRYLEYKTPLESISIILVMAGIMTIFILAIITPVLVRNRKALKSLKRCSDGNLEGACERIDSEIIMENVFKSGPIIITKSYIIVNCQQIVLAMPLTELVWIYKSVQNNKAYGIKINKVISLVLVFSDKDTYSISLFGKHSKNIDNIIEHISKRCPTAFIGFSEEYKTLLKKSPDKFLEQWKNSKENITINL